VSYIISPAMNLLVPTVGGEPGPNYAYDINNDLSLIDQHDHSPGRGVQITPAGININAPLSFNNNPAIQVSYLSLQAQSVAVSEVQSVSSAPASGINELWYTDSNGTKTQITANGVVNATAAAIPGESYSAGTFIWTQTQSSLPTTPANFDIGSITIRPNTAGTTDGVELSPPGSISSEYTLTLPLIPANNGVLLLDTSGNITAPNGFGTAGSVLTSNGSSTAPSFQAYKAPTKQIFTSGSGTYTTPAGALYIVVRAIGGGGGGGGCAHVTNQASAAAGGGGGGYCELTIPSPSSTYSYSVGSGGAGGIGNNQGSIGGNSTFGSMTADGGGGGDGGPGSANTNTVNAQAGTGGSSSGGDLNVVGGCGGPGIIMGTQFEMLGGFGGNSSLGGGAYPIQITPINTATTGNNGNQYGGGGGGSTVSNGASTPVSTGGNGAAGIIIVEEYYS
jgi:hypothetical protein